MFILSQILGVVATLFSCIAIYNSSNRKIFYIYETIFCVLYALSLSFVSAWTGTALMIIGTIRMLLFYFYEKKNIKKPVFILILFLIITLISSILTYSHWSCIPLMISALIYVWAIWQEKQMPLLILTIIYSISNIIYNAYSQAYTCIILELLIIISTVFTIIKSKTKNPQ